MMIERTIMIPTFFHSLTEAGFLPVIWFICVQTLQFLFPNPHGMELSFEN